MKPLCSMLGRAFAGAFFVTAVFVVGRSSAIAGGTLWERVTVHADNPPLVGIAMADDSVAVVVSPSQRIFRSNDGGLTWAERNTGFPPVLPPSGRQLYDVTFGTSMNGLAVGTPGAITRTTDAGLTWTNISMSDGWLRNVSMVGASFAVIPGSPVYYTTDGGTTWTAAPFLGEGAVLDAVMLDTVHGYGIGGAGLTGASVIYETIDGSRTWEEKYAPQIFTSLTAIAFSGGSHGAAVGYDGVILSTTNGGGSWKITRSDQRDTLYAVAFRDEMNAFAVGSGGTILHSTDGGATWMKESSPVTSDLKGVACHGSLTLISGDSGVMLRSQAVSAVPDDRNVGSAAASLDLSPNPLRGVGSVSCNLSRRSAIRLTLVDALGRDVATLLEGDLERGEHRVPLDPAGLPAGAYFLHLLADGAVTVRSITIVR